MYASCPFLFLIVGTNGQRVPHDLWLMEDFSTDGGSGRGNSVQLESSVGFSRVCVFMVFGHLRTTNHRQAESIPNTPRMKGYVVIFSPFILQGKLFSWETCHSCYLPSRVFSLSVSDGEMPLSWRECEHVMHYIVNVTGWRTPKTLNTQCSDSDVTNYSNNTHTHYIIRGHVCVSLPNWTEKHLNHSHIKY